METIIEWGIWALVLCFAAFVVLGIVGAVFIDGDAKDAPSRKPRRGLGRALVAGILLGMWLDE